MSLNTIITVLFSLLFALFCSSLRAEPGPIKKSATLETNSQLELTGLR